MHFAYILSATPLSTTITVLAFKDWRILTILANHAPLMYRSIHGQFPLFVIPSWRAIVNFRQYCGTLACYKRLRHICWINHVSIISRNYLSKVWLLWLCNHLNTHHLSLLILIVIRVHCRLFPFPYMYDLQIITIIKLMYPI